VNPSDLLAYCYRSLLYLKLNKMKEFETDIQWAVWVATYSECPRVTPAVQEFLKVFLQSYAESVNYLK
jgi:hypothetical protein